MTQLQLSDIFLCGGEAFFSPFIILLLNLNINESPARKNIGKCLLYNYSCCSIDKIFSDFGLFGFLSSDFDGEGDAVT